MVHVILILLLAFVDFSKIQVIKIKIKRRILGIKYFILIEAKSPKMNQSKIIVI